MPRLALPLPFSVSFFIFASGLSAGLSGSALASDYPPGYSIERSCQKKGPVEVCVINQHYGNYPRLELRYAGTLLGEGQRAWVQLNSRSNVFALSDGLLALNQPVSTRCWVGGVPMGMEGGQYQGCEQEHTEPKGYLAWEVSPIDPLEADIFFYARNEFGRANAWDIEVALVDANGNWDSLYGSNYHFRFE